VQKKETPYYEGEEIKIEISENVEDFSFCPISRVTEKEALNLRRHEKLGFILKMGDKIYYAKLPPEAKFLFQRIFTKHLCSTCAHCFARPSSEGGCEKIMDPDFYWYGDHIGTIMENIIGSKRIEKYPFIQRGFQTFNIDEQDFIIAACKNYCAEK
jgi:hypothetical protein